MHNLVKFQCDCKIPVGESRLNSRDKNVIVTDAQMTDANNFGAHRNAASYDMSALQRRRPDAALHSTQLPAFHFRHAHLPPRQSETRSGGSEHSPFLFLVPRLSLRDVLISLRSAVRVPDLLRSICLASSLPCLYSSLFALCCMHSFEVSGNPRACGLIFLLSDVFAGAGVGFLLSTRSRSLASLLAIISSSPRPCLPPCPHAFWS